MQNMYNLHAFMLVVPERTMRTRFLKKYANSVPHPDVFSCRLNGMGAQKNAPQKVLVTFSIYISRKN